MRDLAGVVVNNMENIVETLYDVEDIMRIFKCEKRKARAIMNIRGFPTMTIGREKRVVPSRLNSWIEQHNDKILYLDY